MNNIVFVAREKIDETRWNNCVSASPVCLPYAHTWYLDAVAQHWDGLILNDYEAVMPVPWYRMLAIKKVYQPHYCQQGGVFSESALDSSIIHAFIDVLSSHFFSCYVQLNYTNPLPHHYDGFTIRKNLILDMQKDCEHLQLAFSQNHQRNIRKATKAGLRYLIHNDTDAFYSFYQSTLQPGREVFKEAHQQALKRLLTILSQKQMLTVHVVQDSGQNWQAACLLLSYKNRLINIINGSSQSGKSVGASHYLFNQIISQHAGSGRVLDFEGSSIPSIARFYEGFGAVEQSYYAFQFNSVQKLKQRFL